MQLTMGEASMQMRGRQFCTFLICGRHYGVDILEVKEINAEVDCTSIFHAPREVRGYVNIRGQIYLILDLSLILGFGPAEVDEGSRVVLFNAEVGEPFGVLVDRIGDIITVDEEHIEDRRREDQGLAEAVERAAPELAEGVCKLEDGLVVILDAKKLLNLIQQIKA